MHTQAPTPTEANTRLEALAGELAARGWITRVHSPAGQLPNLYVQNPDPGASMLSEHIYAAPRADGTWTYWWPWAQPLVATAARDAADTIIRVLRAAGAQ
jgi:hypothetical protein